MDAQTVKPHRGTLILILGILGIFCCGFSLGIPALIMGSADLKEMDAGTMDPAGRGSTNGGKICGIIGLVLWVRHNCTSRIQSSLSGLLINPIPQIGVRKVYRIFCPLCFVPSWRADSCYSIHLEVWR